MYFISTLGSSRQRLNAEHKQKWLPWTIGFIRRCLNNTFIKVCPPLQRDFTAFLGCLMFLFILLSTPGFKEQLLGENPIIEQEL